MNHTGVQLEQQGNRLNWRELYGLKTGLTGAVHLVEVGAPEAQRERLVHTLCHTAEVTREKIGHPSSDDWKIYYRESNDIHIFQAR